MLFLSGPSAGRSTFPFAGAGFGGTAEIIELQKALYAYGSATGKMPEAAPCPPGGSCYNGNLNDDTVLAAIYVAWREASKVPGLKQIKAGIEKIPGISTIVNIAIGNHIVRSALWPGVPAGVKNDIKNFVGSHAGIIAAGVRAAMGGGAGGFPPPPPDLPVNPTLVLLSPALNLTRKVTDAGGAAKIAAFDAKKGVYRIAVARGVGATEATHTEVGTSASPPADARVVPIEEFKKLVGEKNVMKGILIGAGVAVGVVGLGWFLLK
jgi:hypothetical protein